MFEKMINFFKSLSKKEEQSNPSKDTAKERLHLVLMQDRANVSADFLELMKQEIIEVIKKYIDIDEKSIDVRLTNKANDDGTTGAPSLYANIPILNVRNDMKKQVINENEKPFSNKIENVEEVEKTEKAEDVELEENEEAKKIIENSEENEEELVYEKEQEEIIEKEETEDDVEVEQQDEEENTENEEEQEEVEEKVENVEPAEKVQTINQNQTINRPYTNSNKKKHYNGKKKKNRKK